MLPYGVLSAGLIFGKVGRCRFCSKISSLWREAAAAATGRGGMAIGGAKCASGERLAARRGGPALDFYYRARGRRSRSAGDRFALSAHASAGSRPYLQL